MMWTDSLASQESMYTVRLGLKNNSKYASADRFSYSASEAKLTNRREKFKISIV